MIFAALLAATIAYPAAGTYTYEIDTPKGVTFRTTIVIAVSARGITTDETFGVPTIATTEQHFDRQLHEEEFRATQAASGNSITITFSPTTATYNVGGKTFQAKLDAPDCVLVEDNVLTSAVMLPAVLQATDGGACTFALSTAVETLRADITIAPLARPPSAAANDTSIVARIGNVKETIWYDSGTLIPDYIDFGDSGSARLIASSH